MKNKKQKYGWDQKPRRVRKWIKMQIKVNFQIIYNNSIEEEKKGDEAMEEEEESCDDDEKIDSYAQEGKRRV